MESDEAASPVMGLILMVAITMVLAATAYLLVNDIGQGSDADAPDVSFVTTETDDRIRVTRAPEGVAYAAFEWRVRGGLDPGYALCYAFNTPASATVAGTCDSADTTTSQAGSVGPDHAPMDPGTPLDRYILGGDFFSVCVTHATDAQPHEDVALVISHAESNTVLMASGFSHVSPC